MLPCVFLDRQTDTKAPHLHQGLPFPLPLPVEYFCPLKAIKASDVRGLGPAPPPTGRCWPLTACSSLLLPAPAPCPVTIPTGETCPASDSKHRTPKLKPSDMGGHSRPGHLPQWCPQAHRGPGHRWLSIPHPQSSALHQAPPPSLEPRPGPLSLTHHILCGGLSPLVPTGSSALGAER